LEYGNAVTAFLTYCATGDPAKLDELVRWEMIGPVFEKDFGIIFRSPVNLIAELEYAPEKWTGNFYLLRRSLIFVEKAA
jgi:hypothetical protein